jgi:hypothetical protein
MSCINVANQNTMLRIIDRIDFLKDFDDCAETELPLQRSEPEQLSQQVEDSFDTVGQDVADLASEWCANVIDISGTFPQVKAARRTLKKHGIMDTCDCSRFPLDGHWKTEHGLVVVIERKTVRWTPQRASRLRFEGIDRRSCSLSMYGELVQGRLVSELIPGVAKSLEWSNGTVWHCHDGNLVGQATLLSQTMTKIERDVSRDEIIRSSMGSALQLVSKSGLQLPADCVHDVLQCMGSTTYFVQVRFRSHENPPWAAGEEFDFLSRLAQHHPLCKIRHEWTGGSQGLRGQRIINDM